MATVVNRNHQLLTLSGLCLAAAFSLPGCASERTSRPAFGWARNLLPFRSHRVAERNESEAVMDLATPAPRLEWTPSEPSDDYFAPQTSEFVQPRSATPPPAPPASEPGFFADESDTATHNTSGRSPQSDRPARLRDVFEAWKRRSTNETAPEIPLDEPVAALTRESAVQVVEFEQVEAVVLGAPVFELAK